MIWDLDGLLEKTFIDICPYWTDLKSTSKFFFDRLIDAYKETDAYKRLLALNINSYEFTICEDLYKKLGLISISFEYTDDKYNSICIDDRNKVYITNVVLTGNTDLLFYFNSMLKSYGCHGYFKIKITDYGTKKSFSKGNMTFDDIMVDGLEFLYKEEFCPSNIFDIIDFLGNSFDYEVKFKSLNRLINKVYYYSYKSENLNILLENSLVDFYDKISLNKVNSNISILVSYFKNIYIVLNKDLLESFIDSKNWLDVVILGDILRKYGMKIKIQESDEIYLSMYTKKIDYINELINEYLGDLLEY